MGLVMRDRAARGGMVVLLAAVGAAAGTFAASRPTESAPAGMTDIIARRIVVNNTAYPGVKLLTIPGLGELTGYCQDGSDDAWISWSNRTGGPVDRWTDYTGPIRGHVIPNGQVYQNAASWDSSTKTQIGRHLELGKGNSPGPRRTASITLNIYRGGVDAPCGFQAMATTWKVD